MWSGIVILSVFPLLRLLEKLFIDFLDVQRFFDPAPNIVADHKTSKLYSINEDNPLAQMLRRFLCGS
jgi:hypothetical protein